MRISGCVVCIILIIMPAGGIEVKGENRNLHELLSFSPSPPDQTFLRITQHDNSLPGHSVPKRDKDKILVANSLVGGGIVSYFFYGCYAFWDNANFHHFKISPLNDPKQRNYAGGADKFAHAYGSYYLTRAVSTLYRWAGISQHKATWIGFAASQTLLLVGEIEDGFTLKYGFDPVDIIANVIGGTFSIFEEYFPSLNRCVDLRMNYWPSSEYQNHDEFKSFAEDYSGQRYYLVFKFEGLQLPQNLSWLRYVEVFCGFQSKGYKPGYTHTIEKSMSEYESFYKERNILLGLSVNLREVLNNSILKKTPSTGLKKSTDVFFEYYQHPLMISHNAHISNERHYYRKLTNN